jgi:putative PEP-CTERM system TPR-repeat lipoprotein
MPPMITLSYRSVRPLRFAAALLLGASLLAAVPAEASVERARAAQARGDLRAAQIELRNAVRNDPNSAAVRAALAQASLDLGDTDTAEKEARAALERGYDPVAGHALLLRSYLGRQRFQDLLREFPAPDASVADGVAAQILAARGIAQFGLDRRDEAAASVAEALRRGPGLAETNLAAATLAIANRDNAGAEAAVDRALAAAPNNTDALLRKGALQVDRGDVRGGAETFGKLVAVMPGNLQGRVRRAEALVRLGDDAEARKETDVALRLAPASPQANFLSAMLQVRAQDWRSADETLQRIGAGVQNFPDGLLMLATVKRAVGQINQAEDAARRHVARRPDDPRGAKLLAAIEMQLNQPDAAAGTLDRLVQRGAADAEALDMLGRAHVAAGRAREASVAFERSAALRQGDAGTLARLATTRLSSGDAVGATEAAEASLAIEPNQPAMRQVLAAAALARGDLARATAELERLPPASRDGELVGLIEGTIRLVRVDNEGARVAFEAVLRNHPNSTRARLGLARVAAMQGRGEDVERLLGEVLERDPNNAEAASRLIAASVSGTPRAAPARAVLERVQAAKPDEPALAIALAQVLLRTSEPAKAAAVLDAEPLRTRRGVQGNLLLAEARAAQEQWTEARDAAQAALNLDPESVPARQTVAALQLRAGDPRAAEATIQRGLTTQPGNMILQQSLVQIARQSRGLEAALETADALARQPSTRPSSLTLRGDLLMSAEKPEEAAEAYRRAYAAAPSRVLAQRLAGALQVQRKQDEAAAVLEAWVARTPDDMATIAQLAQFDILANRTEQAEQRLRTVVAAQPEDATSLNNLAWLMQGRANPATDAGRATLAEARLLAERAYYISPTPETSDTLGWILARGGDARAGLPLLRQAAAATLARRAPDPAMFFRLAYALRATGERAEALRVLEPILAPEVQFPERAEAEKLAAELRAGG